MEDFPGVVGEAEMVDGDDGRVVHRKQCLENTGWNAVALAKTIIKYGLKIV